MCLKEKGLKVHNPPLEGVREAWKVMKVLWRREGMGYAGYFLEARHNPGEWYSAVGEPPIRSRAMVPMRMALFYPAGFHCFTFKADAEEFLAVRFYRPVTLRNSLRVVKVLVDKIVAEGFDDNSPYRRTIVAQKMYIPPPMVEKGEK